MVWSLVSSSRYSSTNIYEYPSGRASWSLTHELYWKWYLICKLHIFSPEPNDVICCLLLPRVITEPNFNSILGMEIKSYGGAYPIPSSNHLCLTHNRQKHPWKREKHLWKSVTFSKPQVTLLHECFSRFLNCANGTKSYKTSHQNLLSIRENWKIVGSKFFGKLKIDGNLVVKSKVPPRSGSVALR